MKPGSLIRNAFVGFIWVFVLMAAVGACLGGGADEASDDDTTVEASDDTEELEDADDGEYSVLITVEDEGGEPVENADVTFVHDDAMIFVTREDRQTDAEGQVEITTEGGSTSIEVSASGYEDRDLDATIDSDDEVTVVLEEEVEEPDPPEEESDDNSDDSTSDAAGEVEASEDIDSSSEGSFTAEEYGALAAIVYQDNTNGEWLGYSESGGVGYAEVSSGSYGDTNVLAGEIGTVSGTYVSYVTDEDSDAPDRLVVFVYEADGVTEAGEYYIEAEWAVAYSNGELTDEEYSQRVFGTIETYD